VNGGSVDRRSLSRSKKPESKKRGSKKRELPAGRRVSLC
jgi:hypothetical protein